MASLPPPPPALPPLRLLLADPRRELAAFRDLAESAAVEEAEAEPLRLPPERGLAVVSEHLRALALSPPRPFFGLEVGDAEGSMSRERGRLRLRLRCPPKLEINAIKAPAAHSSSAEHSEMVGCWEEASLSLSPLPPLSSPPLSSAAARRSCRKSCVRAAIPAMAVASAAAVFGDESFPTCSAEIR